MLQKIIHFIENQLKKPLLTSGNQYNSKQFIKLLNTVLTLLKKSQNGSRIDYLIKATYSLEAHLAPHNHEENNLQNIHCLNKKTINYQIHTKELQIPQHNIFIIKEIHELLLAIPNLKNCSWIYHFPQNEQGNITNPSIAKWKNLLSYKQSTPYKAFVDFTRDVGLGNKHPKNKQEVHKFCEELIEKTKYPNCQQVLVLNWLFANGGQDMNRFLDQCIMDHYLENKLYSGNLFPVLAEAQSITQNWKVLKNGNLAFEYAVKIYSLIYGEEGFLFLDKKLQTQFTTNTLDYIEQRQSAKKQPLLYVHAIIELDISNYIPQLNMKRFTILSTTPNLCINPNPKQQLNEKKIESLSHYHPKNQAIKLTFSPAQQQINQQTEQSKSFLSKITFGYL